MTVPNLSRCLELFVHARASIRVPALFQVVLVLVSIRAPRINAGRLGQREVGGGADGVSIRAPRINAERLLPKIAQGLEDSFQSAPRECCPGLPQSALATAFRRMRGRFHRCQVPPTG